VKLSSGKLAGMKSVSNENGVIAAAAMDQRGSLKKALGTRATDEGLAESKSLVTEVLTQHASAILLDPEWGLEPSRHRAKGSGLLLAYEKDGLRCKSGWSPARFTRPLVGSPLEGSWRRLYQDPAVLLSI
jgi:tagatose 1,6-diphosphate aldolase